MVTTKPLRMLDPTFCASTPTHSRHAVPSQVLWDNFGFDSVGDTAVGRKGSSTAAAATAAVVAAASS